ncbi:MAG: alpha/beta fold hydrolase [Actinobacteria bacterium]|nr:alpha/beta fold hydrolase [Actinomycetota bacterium]
MRLHYEIGGSGPRVLFFNGSGATLEGSAVIIKGLREFSSVLAHDQRGLGKTGVIDGPFTMQQYAQDSAELLDHVGWKSCIIVGISFGGMVAQEFAVTHPERVEKLVLLCTAAGGVAGASYPLHEDVHLDPAARADKQIPIFDTRFTPDHLAKDAFAAALAKMLRDREHVPKSDEVRRGEVLQLEARRHHDVAGRLGRITCPTLVMAGKYDGIAPVANCQAIADRIPNSELRIYDGGHLFIAQDPAAVADIGRFVVEPNF